MQGVLDQILWAPLLFLNLFLLWIPGHILVLSQDAGRGKVVAEGGMA